MLAASATEAASRRALEGPAPGRPATGCHRPLSIPLQRPEGSGRGDFSKIPNGLPGVEDRFTLIFHGGVNSGRITLNRFVELVATAPAKMFGLFPRKGTIAPGSDADIVIFNPNVERTLSAKTHHMNVDYSCYEGMTIKGLPEVVMQRGNVLVRDGKFQGRPGAGQFLRRSPFHGKLAAQPSTVGARA